MLHLSSTSRTKFPLSALQRISFSMQKTAVSVLCPGRYADWNLNNLAWFLGGFKFKRFDCHIFLCHYPRWVTNQKYIVAVLIFFSFFVWSHHLRQHAQSQISSSVLYPSKFIPAFKHSCQIWSSNSDNEKEGHGPHTKQKIIRHSLSS